MLRDLSGFELRTRLTEAIYPGQVVFPGWTCETIERVLAKTVWVVGSIALTGILIACLFYGEPIQAQAQAWALSLLALSLQTFFMFVIAPAFVPSDTHKRLAQLYLPISNKQISQTWFPKSKTWYGLAISRHRFHGYGRVVLPSVMDMDTNARGLANICVTHGCP